MEGGRIMDYSKFFIEKDGVESSCVINDGDTFQIVLGHEKNHHHLLSVVNLDGKYEVAVFKINTNGKISNKSWANPIVQKTFTDFDECRKFYKSCAENY